MSCFWARLKKGTRGQIERYIAVRSNVVGVRVCVGEREMGKEGNKMDGGGRSESRQAKQRQNRPRLPQGTIWVRGEAGRYVLRVHLGSRSYVRSRQIGEGKYNRPQRQEELVQIMGPFDRTGWVPGRGTSCGAPRANRGTELCYWTFMTTRMDGEACPHHPSAIYPTERCVYLHYQAMCGLGCSYSCGFSQGMQAISRHSRWD